MKHISILVALTALLTLAACDDGVPCPPVQGNPQGPVFETSDLVISAPTDAETGEPVAIDLRTAGATVTVGAYTLENWNYNYELSLTMFMAADPSMEGAASLPATAQPDGTVTVAAALLEKAWVETISKSPDTRTVSVNFAARADREGESGYILGGLDHRYGNYELTVTPATPPYTIEPRYYMISPATNWTEGTPLELTHSLTNQYDDPVFSTTVNISATEAANGFGWVIVGESQLKDLKTGNFKALTGAVPSGTLTEITGTADAGKVSFSGPVRFDFDMETLHYDIFVAYDCLYTPGVANDWMQTDSQRLTTRDFNTYTGFANLEFAFRLSATPDWTVAWGFDESTGKLEAGSIDNIRVDHNGLNFVAADLNELTCGVTPVTRIALTGRGVEGGEAELATDRRNPLVARGTVTFTAEGAAWRVMCNTGTPSLGGTADCLVTDPDAPDLTAPAAGTYNATLNLGNIPYTINLTPQE